MAARAIHSVDRLITLHNGNPTDNEEYHKHYKCFDAMPIVFADIEMIFDDERQAVV